MLKQPEDRVIEWSPGYIWHLAEYALNFKFLGMDPIQFGIIMVLNCGIGLLTPPVGSVLFIGSAIAKRPMEKIVKAQLPFYLSMIIALLLITFIPAISLCVPWLFGYMGGR